MISYSKMSSAGGSAHYLSGEQSLGRVDGQAEYYMAENTPSEWGGRACGMADFTPGKSVNQEDLLSTLEGLIYNPAQYTDQQLGRIVDGERQHRPGLDLTFSAPKSVSIVGLVGGDERIRAAHEAAVCRALGYIEDNAGTRVRESGQGAASHVDYKNTGNLLIAKFQHDTSREMDPQIHTHAAIANATWDKDSGRWRSLDYNSVITQLKTADGIYKNELASNLQKLGYDVEWGKNGPEIKDVSKAQRDQYSKRTQEIEEALAERGQSRESSNAETRNLAALATRSDKQHIDRPILNNRWRQEALAVGLDVDSIVSKSRERIESPTKDQPRFNSASEIVKQAIAHLGEREQAFSQSELVRSANEFSRGRVGADGIDQAIRDLKESGELRDRGYQDKKGHAMLTTSNAIDTEKASVRMVEEGKGQLKSILDSQKVSTLIDIRDDKAREGGGFALNSGQRDAAIMILTSEDRFMAVQGYAGTGKTSMLTTIREILDQQGIKVIGLSSGANQAGILERDSGIKSQTVASFLAEQSKLTESADYIEQKGGKVSRLAKAIAFSESRSEIDVGLKIYGIGKRDVFVSDSHYNRAMRDTFQSRSDQALHDYRHAPTVGDMVDAGIKHALTGVAAKMSNDAMQWKVAHGMDALEARVLSKTLAVEAGIREYRDQQNILDVAHGKHRQVWVVDESSQLSQRDMVAIQKLAIDRNAQVVFVGDKLQLESVGAGKAFANMQEAGVKTAELSEINRQKDDVGKAVVADVLAGDIRSAFDRLSKVEIRSEQAEIDQRYTGRALTSSDLIQKNMELSLARGIDNLAVINALAKNYATSEVRDNTIIVTATNTDRLAINNAVRSELKSAGLLGKEELSLQSLEAVKLSASEAKEAWRYESGMTVLADRNYKADEIAKGTMFRVTSVDQARNTVSMVDDKTGREFIFNPSQRTGFSLYTTRELNLAAGDVVGFTKNDRDMNVNNGEQGRVVSVGNGKINIMVGGKEIALNTNESHHIRHGYATTSFGSQGDTRSKTLYHINTSGAGVGDRDFYVGVTRAKEGTIIYTNSLEKAAAIVERSQDKTTALDHDNNLNAKVIKLEKTKIADSEENERHHHGMRI